MEEEIIELRKDLEKYRGEEKNPEHLYIGLFGRSGCGKTSLINSLMFAVSGPTRKGKWLPVGNIEKAGGHTLMRVIAPLVGNISVIDNRGVDDLTKDGVSKELKAQIDGKRGFSVAVKWEKPQGAADKCDIIDAEKGKYVIGCSVFVFSAKDSIRQSTNGLFMAVRSLQEQQGRYPVGVITHVDVADEQCVATLRSTLKVTGISEIYEVANITENNEVLQICHQHNLLSLLDRCMTDSDANAALNRHRQEEQMDEQKREEKKKREEAQKREEKQKREEEQKREEQKKREADEKERAGRLGATVMGAAGTGAAIGLMAGPVGSVIGAGIGAAVGASLAIKNWFH